MSRNDQPGKGNAKRDDRSKMRDDQPLDEQARARAGQMTDEEMETETAEPRSGTAGMREKKGNQPR